MPGSPVKPSARGQLSHRSAQSSSRVKKKKKKAKVEKPAADDDLEVPAGIGTAGDLYRCGD